MNLVDLLDFMCESCSDIAHSLAELGFCPQPWEDQRKLLKEYHHFKVLNP